MLSRWSGVRRSWALLAFALACARFDYELLPVAKSGPPTLDAGDVAERPLDGGVRGGGPAGAGGFGGGTPGAGGLGGSQSPSDGSRPDAGSPDAATAGACVVGVPQPLLGLGLSGSLWRPDLASDGSTLFLARSSGSVQQIFSATRSVGAQFGPATALLEVNGPALDGTPFLSADRLTLYFFSTRPGGPGSRDLWTASRAQDQGTFQPAQLLPIVNASGIDQVPTLTPDERIMIWESVRPGGAGDADLWMAERANRTEDFSAPVNLAELNTSAQEGGPSLSSDGLTLFFISNRDGGLPDIWSATRADTASPFGTPSPVSEVNSPDDEHDPFITPDSRELFFSSDRSGTQELWVEQRICP